MNQIDTTPYQEFAKEKLGFSFKDISLLVTALTHRSYVNEHKNTVHEHNERLGDGEHPPLGAASRP